MTIARRLTLLLAVPLLVLAGLGIFVVRQLETIETKSRFVAETQIESLAVLGNISRNTSNIRVNVRSYLMDEDKAQQTRAEAAIRENHKDLTSLLSRYGDALITGEADRRLFTEYRDLNREWIVVTERLMSMAAAGQRDEAIPQMLAGTYPEMGQHMGTVLGNWIKLNEDLAKAAGKETIAAIEESERRLVVALVLGMLISGTLGVFTLRRIVLPVRALQTSVQSIAGGDYAQAVPGTQATDETGALPARSTSSNRAPQRWSRNAGSKRTSPSSRGHCRERSL
jgi:methyl-accepting chemotaxis protein